MNRELQLRIHTIADGAATKKSLLDTSKILREQKKIIDESGKSHLKVLKDSERSFGNVSRAAETFGRNMGNAFTSAMHGVERFNKGFDFLKRNVLSFKNIVVGSLAGGLAFEGIKKVIDAGSQAMLARARITREFGAEGKGMTARALLLARQAGISNEEALRAIIPIGEAVGETQKGTLFRGRRLSEAGAAGVRAQTFGVGANLLSRIATVTGVSPDEAGQLLAEAGMGPEGMRRFAGTLGLNRAFSRRATEANQKGKLADLLGADKAKQFGLKRGQVAGQGTLLDIILQQSGVTEGAADAMRRTFGFQKKAIGSQFGNILGDIGEDVLAKLNKNLGQGKTLAERFQEALASDRGKRVLGQISTTIDKMVEGAVKFGEALPRAFKFVEDHKTALMVAGGAFVGMRALGSVGKLLGGAKQGLGSLGFSDAGAIPVRVVNLPGGLGGGAGGALSKLLGGGAGGGSSLVGGALEALGGAGLALGVAGLGAGAYAAYGMWQQHRQDREDAKNAARAVSGIVSRDDGGYHTGDDLDSKFGGFAGKFTKKKIAGPENLSPEIMALNAMMNGAKPPANPEISALNAELNRPFQIQLNIDGQKITEVVEKRMAQNFRNRTAGGVAPR